LQLHDAGNLTVPLRAAPHMPFRPHQQFAQLVDGQVIVPPSPSRVARNALFEVA
jgi:hypothetical protein